MGLQDVLSRIKDKTRSSSAKPNSDTPPSKPRASPAPATPNLGEEIRQTVQSRPFENGFMSAAPFLCASLGAWPGYWLFRGMDYHTYRAHIPLPIYIRQARRANTIS